MKHTEYPCLGCKARSRKCFPFQTSSRAGPWWTKGVWGTEWEPFPSALILCTSVGENSSKLWNRRPRLLQSGPGTDLLRGMLVARPHTGPPATNHQSPIMLPLDLQHCLLAWLAHMGKSCASALDTALETQHLSSNPGLNCAMVAFTGAACVSRVKQWGVHLG